MDRTFGIIDLEGSLLDNIIRKHPKVDNIIEAKLLLLEAYETTFNIFDHLKQVEIERSNKDHTGKRPLAVVAYHPAEDIHSPSALYEKIKAYNVLKVYDHFHLSLPEFLNLPVDVSRYIVELCEQNNNRDYLAMKNQIDKLNVDK